MTACGRHAAPGAVWPEINPGCEHIQLIHAGQTAPRPTQALRDFVGHWDEPDKDLRNWLINKACAIGADAVVNVIETEGRDEDGPIWNIRGTAVVYR
jgi:hypothetical protein